MSATRTVSRVLVANRGEVARRVIRTCAALGIETVAVFSDADRGAPFVDEATYAVALGGATATESYLDVAALLDAARRSGADAVHPGYGFLSENAGFAQAVLDAGLVWIGPRPESMRAMALKVEARRLAASVGVPVVPGAELPPGAGPDEVVAAAAAVGYPVLVKASAGGGGKGMRVVRSPHELLDAVGASAREARSSFGDATVFLERYLERVRHVEVQVFGDEHGSLVHLFERECSVQRRHQKIVEESPSPGATPAVLERMYVAALTLARTIDYVGAGTVEFLVVGEGDDQEFFFLEMNTRLQVEHPVTEAVTGLDLVAWQLAVARGEALPLRQDEIVRRGHAVEARLYAEDAARGFLPSTGTVTSWDVEDQEGIRVDSGVEQGSVVTAHYDPLLAKLVAHADGRVAAVGLLADYLRGAAVVGVTTNQDALVRVLSSERFLAGDTTTDLVDGLDLAGPSVPADVRIRHLAVAAAVLLGRAGQAAVLGGAGEAALVGGLRAAAVLGVPRVGAAAGWRNVVGVPETVRVSYRDGAREVLAVLASSWSRSGSVVHVVPDAEALVDERGMEVDPHAAQAIPGSGGATRVGVVTVDRCGAAAPDGFVPYRVEVEGLRSTVDVRHALDDGVERVSVDADGWVTTYDVVPVGSGASGHGGTGGPTTPVPGTVTHVAVAVGDVVEAGTTLVVLESMKMEHAVRADLAGVVSAVHVTIGQSVDAHTVVATLDAETPS